MRPAWSVLLLTTLIGAELHTPKTSRGVRASLNFFFFSSS